MRSTQQKIEDFIEECAIEYKREVTQDNDYSNTGYFTLYKGENAYQARFDFQSRYCTMKYGTGGVKADERYYDYVKDMALLRQHLRSFVKFGDPNVLRP